MDLSVKHQEVVDHYTCRSSKWIVDPGMTEREAYQHD